MAILTGTAGAILALIPQIRALIPSSKTVNKKGIAATLTMMAGLLTIVAAGSVTWAVFGEERCALSTSPIMAFIQAVILLAAGFLMAIDKETDDPDWIPEGFDDKTDLDYL